MAVERAATLYLRNDTTVDSGTGIDIRRLQSSQTGTNDVSQSCDATHTQDNVERTFDPGNANVTAVAAANAFQGEGWALRLTEDMTPADDTNCNVALVAQTPTMQINVTVNQTGGTYTTATWAPLFRAALFRYDPAANTGTLLASTNNGNDTSWTVGIGSDLGTYKTVNLNFTLPGGAFPQGEILLVQVGLNTGTIPNPTLGTATWTVTLRLNNAVSRLVLDSGLIQSCFFVNDIVGEGVVTRGGHALEIARSAVGEGVVTATKVATVSKAFDLIGEGVVTHAKAVALERSASGEGIVSMTRTVVAAKSFTAEGEGVVTRTVAAALERSATGEGTVTVAKAVVASKTFNVTGEGTVTEVHPVQAFRTFTITGEGYLLTSGPNATTITLPIDELPAEGGGVTIIRRFLVIDD